MISEEEIHAWSPEPGDRIEVLLGEYVHCRGVLVARNGNTCFLHCDSYNARYPKAHLSPEWTSSFRSNQVRREQTLADHLDIAVGLLEKPKFGWFDSKARQDRHAVTVRSIRAIASHLQAQYPMVSVADQIKEVTDDGIRRGDPVIITVIEGGGGGVFTGTFIAEYKGRRHVLFQNGGPAAYTSAQVTAAP